MNARTVGQTRGPLRGWSLRPPSRCSGDQPDGGFATIEFAIILGAIVLLTMAIFAVGRYGTATTSVDAAASAGARAASLARTADQARADATSVARATLTQTGIGCSPSVAIDVSGFAVPVGEPATVEVTVSCEVPLTEAAGSRTVTGHAISPLDTYRERGQP
ncbi:MAG: pilus assembly protein [Humibacillus sp.]|nr:pilus assembly protein [Humibacillus sp.]MDN5777138.1 pilus assembly protein [Humibacillus sp.]MDN5804797.1 pilus assembly protein [Microlunatus sp.]